MTTKPVKGIRIKDGKLVRVTPFRARIKAHKTSRLVKAWKGRTQMNQAQINAVRLHEALSRLLDRYKESGRFDHVVEDAERALYEFRPLADWEVHLKAAPATTPPESS